MRGSGTHFPSASKFMGHKADEISNNSLEAALANDLFKTPLISPQMSLRQVAGLQVLWATISGEAR